MMICFTIPTYTISITKILLLLFYIPLLFTPLFFSCYFFHAATPIAYQYFACVVKQQGFVVALCSKPLIMILYLLSPHIQHKHTAPPNAYSTNQHFATILRRSFCRFIQLWAISNKRLPKICFSLQNMSKLCTKSPFRCIILLL